MIKTFIEIGSCDFDTNLKLIENGDWIGVMCEPAPKYFHNLEQIVSGSKNKENLHLENIAISDFDGKIDFTVSKDLTNEDRSMAWVRGISSVTADNHKGERLFEYKDNAKFIEEHLQVPCMRLDSLIAKYKFEHINYLKIDTEGHEINIIEDYSWDIKPDFIKLVHSHIDHLYVANILEAKGYIVYIENRDIYAVR